MLVILHENGKPKAADPRGFNSRADEERIVGHLLPSAFVSTRLIDFEWMLITAAAASSHQYLLKRGYSAASNLHQDSFSLPRRPLSSDGLIGWNRHLPSIRASLSTLFSTIPL